MKLGSSSRPLRVAVVGSGPAAFYTVQHLLRTDDLEVRIDMFERLPAPHGLVRYGVAPDHPKIKSVIAVYDKLADNPAFRFFGNVEYGADLSLEELKAHYDQIVFCTGAQTDRTLGIPGEDLSGSHAATEFVAWYNGHPDFKDHTFDLSHPCAVVVGVGNVAVDVARILCRDTEELARTDIADYALDCLRRSRVREVYLLGRRGPAQAAFSNPEVKELGELVGVEVSTLPSEVALDDASRAALEDKPDRTTQRKLEILEGFAVRAETDKPRRLAIRFLVAPVELLGDERGTVRAVRLVHNEIVREDSGRLVARPTDRFETIESGLVFRSVGYRGVRLPGLPFNEGWGTIPHDSGRVVGDDGKPLAGLYVSGWIKRGPSGVIGTNKPDAGETVRAMLEDLRDAGGVRPRTTDADVANTLAGRGIRFISYEDWKVLDAAERSLGQAQGRPRVKFTDREAFIEALAAR